MVALEGIGDAFDFRQNFPRDQFLVFRLVRAFTPKSVLVNPLHDADGVFDGVFPELRVVTDSLVRIFARFGRQADDLEVEILRAREIEPAQGRRFSGRIRVESDG